MEDRRYESVPLSWIIPDAMRNVTLLCEPQSQGQTPRFPLTTKNSGLSKHRGRSFESNQDFEMRMQHGVAQVGDHALQPVAPRSIPAEKTSVQQRESCEDTVLGYLEGLAAAKKKVAEWIKQKRQEQSGEDVPLSMVGDGTVEMEHTSGNPAVKDLQRGPQELVPRGCVAVASDRGAVSRVGIYQFGQSIFCSAHLSPASRRKAKELDARDYTCEVCDDMDGELPHRQEATLIFQSDDGIFCQSHLSPASQREAKTLDARNYSCEVCDDM
jgi:hypothetical protein